MWYTYILRCSDGSLYTGITNDLKKRIEAHNAGKGGAYTRSHRPVRLAYFQRHHSRSTSLKAEAFIKGLSKPEKEKYLRKKHEKSARAC